MLSYCWSDWGQPVLDSDRQMVHLITCQVFFEKFLRLSKQFPRKTSQMVPCNKPSGTSGYHKNSQFFVFQPHLRQRFIASVTYHIHIICLLYDFLVPPVGIFPAVLVANRYFELNQDVFLTLSKCYWASPKQREEREIEREISTKIYNIMKLSGAVGRFCLPWTEPG